MAASKKPATKRKPTTTSSKTESAKTTVAKADPIQDTVEKIRGFQINTLIAIGLGIAFVLFQFVDQLQFQWWLNIAAAGASAFLFWRQSDITTGDEQKVCRWGLLLVLALFVLRDIEISIELANYDDRFGDIAELNF